MAFKQSFNLVLSNFLLLNKVVTTLSYKRGLLETTESTKKVSSLSGFMYGSWHRTRPQHFYLLYIKYGSSLPVWENIYRLIYLISCSTLFTITSLSFSCHWQPVLSRSLRRRLYLTAHEGLLDENFKWKADLPQSSLGTNGWSQLSTYYILLWVNYSERLSSPRNWSPLKVNRSVVTPNEYSFPETTFV